MAALIPYTESYNIFLVFVSIAIAIVATFSTFGTAERMISATSQIRKLAWNLYGAFSLGLGIWAMHFIGMLALQLPIPVSYDFTLTIISFIPAFFASSVILWVMARLTCSYKCLLFNGVFLGAGIALMHYIGVSAMRLNAAMSHDKLLSALSIVSAVVVATVALKINNKAFKSERRQWLDKTKMVSAAVMGLAVSSMHYTAMAAVTFFPESHANSGQGISLSGLVIIVSIVAFVIVITSTLVPHFLRVKQTAIELSGLIEKEKKTTARIQSIMDSSQDALVQINAPGEISGWSTQAENIFGWAEEDIIGKAITDLVSYDKEGVERLTTAIREMDPDALQGVMEAEGVHRDGYRFPVEFTIGFLDIDGRQELNAFVRDLSARRRDDEVLLALAETGGSEGISFYKKIVRQLSISHKMRFAAIASINKENPKVVDTLAMWGDGQHIENTSYDLSGGPGESVITAGEVCFYDHGVKALYPNNYLIGTMEIESYLGIPIKNRDGEVIALIGILDDKPISQALSVSTLLTTLATRIGIELEREAAEKRLKLLAQVFTDSREAIIITDEKTHIIDVNPAFTEMTGYSLKEALGQNPIALKTAANELPQPYEGLLHSLDRHGYWKGEAWNRKKNGELYAEYMTISALKDEEGKTLNFVGISLDITRSKEQQKELQMMAHYDGLTGLPNRTLFSDRFTQAVAHSKRFDTFLAVCFIDLDDFKPVNDLYGHSVGDQLLIDVSGRLKSSIREEDTVSRQGGDEFTLILGDLNAFPPCEEMLLRIIDALAKPYHINGNEIVISASLGLTLFPHDNNDVDTLVRHADQAMYQAKLAGKNRYHLFDPDIDLETSQKHLQLSEIQLALSDAQFCLYYQPKVNMETGLVYGAEALIRWQHPEKGLVPPLDFLPIIADTALEITVGEWVIEQALSQMNIWNQQGLTLDVSVNIASHHLRSTRFSSHLQAALSKWPTIKPSQLQLEVLESSQLGDIDQICSIIEFCQNDIGVQVALDDFGTGYSSLTHLRNLPAQIIKVDQTFVRNMLDNSDDYAIIDGIIGLADSFDRDVIAEGVETTEHGLMLMLMGCNHAQGYGIARPMPAEEVNSWVKNYIPNEEWINLNHSNSSHKVRRNQLLVLISKQWIKLFEAAIYSCSNEVKKWPIMDQANCPCGSWLNREKHEKMFDEQWFLEIDAIHSQIHALADSIKILFYEQKHDAVKEGFSSILLKMDRVRVLLEI